MRDGGSGVRQQMGACTGDGDTSKTQTHLHIRVPRQAAEIPAAVGEIGTQCGAGSYAVLHGSNKEGIVLFGCQVIGVCERWVFERGA